MHFNATDEFIAAQHQEVLASSLTKRVALGPEQSKQFSFKYSMYAAYKEYLWRKQAMSLLLRYPAIAQVQRKARQDGGLSKNGQWLRLAEMVDLLKYFSPRTVCEFGSGTSSALLAAICPGKVTTFEESEYWLKRTQEAMGGLANGIDLKWAQRVVEQRGEELVCYYDMDHARAYDLVYVDGPVSEPPEHLKASPNIKDPKGYMPNVDVELFWENNVFPKVIVIDGRRATVRRLLEKSEDRYKVFLKSDFYYNMNAAHPGAFRFHTILVRK